MRSPQVDFGDLGIPSYVRIVTADMSHFPGSASSVRRRTSRYASQLGARYSTFAGAGRRVPLATRRASVASHTPRPRGDDIAGGWSTVDASTPDPATRAVRCAGRASDADPPRSHIVASRRFARGRRGRPVPRVTSAGASARSSVALGNDAPHGRAAKSRRARRRRLVSRRPARFQGTRRRPPRRRRGRRAPRPQPSPRAPRRGRLPVHPRRVEPDPPRDNPARHVRGRLPVHPRRVERCAPASPTSDPGRHRERIRERILSRRRPPRQAPRAPRTKRTRRTRRTRRTKRTRRTYPRYPRTYPRVGLHGSSAPFARGFPCASPPHPERRRFTSPGHRHQRDVRAREARAAHAEGPRARADADGVGDSHRGRVRAERAEGFGVHPQTTGGARRCDARDSRAQTSLVERRAHAGESR